MKKGHYGNDHESCNITLGAENGDISGIPQEPSFAEERFGHWFRKYRRVSTIH